MKLNSLALSVLVVVAGALGCKKAAPPPISNPPVCKVKLPEGTPPTPDAVSWQGVYYVCQQNDKPVPCPADLSSVPNCP